jgi:hypothetical protein
MVARAYAADEIVAGLSQGEWSARRWQWALSFSVHASPAGDPGDAATLPPNAGQHGPVFFLPGAISPASAERICTVPAGTPVLVPVFGATCSTVEAPPFFGRDEAELRAAAKTLADSLDVSRMRVTVDGEMLGDLGRFRVATPLFTLVLPEHNILTTPGGVASCVTDAYQVILAPLPEGQHVIEVTPGGPPGSEPWGAVTYRLMVAAPTVVEPGT